MNEVNIILGVPIIWWFATMADDQEYYGYYYDTEEDRGLLDPAWEKQQRKVIKFNIS